MSEYRFALDDAVAADVEALAADMGISVSRLAAQAVAVFVARFPDREEPVVVYEEDEPGATTEKR